ncbi:MAG: hypothetical protein ACOYMW_02960 [Candidatus Competibacteraceae bacterium]
MLNSYEAIYDHGQIRWVNDSPAIDRARIIITVLDAPLARPLTPRIPPPGLKGSVTYSADYDPFEPALTDADAEVASNRTVRQIAGNS